MKRESSKPISEAIAQFIKQEGLEEGLIRLRIFKAWDMIVGENVAKITYNKYYKDRKLYCNISSSMIRSQLYFVKEELVKNINKQMGAEVVSDIILK